jgi:hypothetical protein
MAEEKKIADEILSDEELEQVAGGNSYTEVGDNRFLNLLEGAGLAKYLVYSGSQRDYAGFACETLTNTFNKYGIEWTIQHGDEADILSFKIDGQWYYPGQVVGTGFEKEVLDYFKKLFPTK